MFRFVVFVGLVLCVAGGKHSDGQAANAKKMGYRADHAKPSEQKCDFKHINAWTECAKKANGATGEDMMKGQCNDDKKAPLAGTCKFCGQSDFSKLSEGSQKIFTCMVEELHLATAAANSLDFKKHLELVESLAKDTNPEGKEVLTKAAEACHAQVNKDDSNGISQAYQTFHVCMYPKMKEACDSKCTKQANHNKKASDRKKDKNGKKDKKSKQTEQAEHAEHVSDEAQPETAQEAEAEHRAEVEADN